MRALSAFLFRHSKASALIVPRVLRVFRPHSAYFYAVHSGSELDLFFISEGRRIGFEFKRVDAPKVSRSMRIALDDLKLDVLNVIYPGKRAYALEDNIRVFPLRYIHRHRVR